MLETLETCSNTMLTQIIIGLILLVVNLALAAGGGIIFYMLKRLIKTNDELPGQFAKVHQRISGCESSDAALEARVGNLERSGGS